MEGDLYLVRNGKFVKTHVDEIKNLHERNPEGRDGYPATVYYVKECKNGHLIEQHYGCWDDNHVDGCIYCAAGFSRCACCSANDCDSTDENVLFSLKCSRTHLPGKSFDIGDRLIVDPTEPLYIIGRSNVRVNITNSLFGLNSDSKAKVGSLNHHAVQYYYKQLNDSIKHAADEQHTLLSLQRDFCKAVSSIQDTKVYNDFLERCATIEVIMLKYWMLHHTLVPEYQDLLVKHQDITLPLLSERLFGMLIGVNVDSFVQSMQTVADYLQNTYS